MNPDEYAAQQAAISAAVASYVLQFATLIARPALSVAEWLSVLQLIFPEIKARREQAADLARTFYDYQRELFYPELPRNDRLLEDYKFEWFAENMEPARQKMSQEDSPVDALATLALRSVREVENAGRKQIIHAVENDPAPQKLIRGWTRVATGEETCAWCLMLVSRGPVYFGASNAGLKRNVTEAETLAAFRDAPDIQTFFESLEGKMQEWHDGCDCKVVPVFKNEGWFGEDAAKRALELWKDATEAAKVSRQLLGPSKKKSGEHKGEDLTLNEEVINVLRSMLENGEIDTSEFAALAA